MKPSTAVRHLVEMATVANDRLPLRDSELGWPLEELWVGGDLLEHPTDLEAGDVVLVLDLPPRRDHTLRHDHRHMGRHGSTKPSSVRELAELNVGIINPNDVHLSNSDKHRHRIDTTQGGDHR